MSRIWIRRKIKNLPLKLSLTKMLINQASTSTIPILSTKTSKTNANCLPANPTKRKLFCFSSCSLKRSSKCRWHTSLSASSSDTTRSPQSADSSNRRTCSKSFTEKALLPIKKRWRRKVSRPLRAKVPTMRRLLPLLRTNKATKQWKFKTLTTCLWVIRKTRARGKQTTRRGLLRRPSSRKHNTNRTKCFSLRNPSLRPPKNSLRSSSSLRG